MFTSTIERYLGFHHLMTGAIVNYSLIRISLFIANSNRNIIYNTNTDACCICLNGEQSAE